MPIFSLAVQQSLADILRAAFSDAYSGLTFGQAAVILLAALLCAGMICLSYRFSFRGAMFSRSFCASLLAMSLITSLLIMAVRTNIYLSLGTLGALSIIRFRTAVKEPMDMAFLFLSISAGIVCGANLLGIALPGVLLISLVLVGISRLPRLRTPYTLVVTGDPASEDAARQLITTAVASARLKSKSVLGGSLELIFEVRLRDVADAFLGELSALPGITGATMVKSSGEYI